MSSNLSGTARRPHSFGVADGSVDAEPHMNVIGIITQLRRDSRNYVERVLLGDVFDIVRRGHRVARLCAIDEGDEPLVLPVNLDEVRNRAGQLCDRVAAGETVTIQYCGRTVAMLVSRPPEDRRMRSGSHSPIRAVALSWITDPW